MEQCGFVVGFVIFFVGNIFVLLFEVFQFDVGLVIFILDISWLQNCMDRFKIGVGFGFVVIDVVIKRVDDGICYNNVIV